MRSDDSGQNSRYSDRHVLFSTERTLLLDEHATAEQGIRLPISIFASRLSGLQAIVRYLHETRRLPFSQIAALLNRSEKTAWSSYHQALPTAFTFSEGGLTIPAALFATRELSVLETIVVYLSSLGFSNADIARLLALDPRTTWTVKRRAELKQEVRP